MEHLLYRELLKRAQHSILTEPIFLVIINTMWPSLVTFLFPMWRGGGKNMLKRSKFL